MPTGLSYQQLMRVPFILRTIRRIHAPGATMTQFYGLGMTPTTGVQQITGRSGQYDIFDGTRSLAPFTAPGAPPVDINRKPVGTQPITVPRQYNKIGIEDEQIFGTRNLGQPYSQPVPNRGEQYFTNQIRYLKTRMMNNMEFMTAHMFRGGWRLKPYATGSSLLVLADATDTTAGGITNDTVVPAGNKTNIGGIIDTSWDDPTANLINQLMNLQALAARQNGRRITEIWMNGITATHLFTNSVLQAVGGSVYQIFSTLNPAKEIAPEQKFPDTGVTVKFRGLPDYNFHVYNQGYTTPGTSEAFSAQIDSANWNYFIPTGKAILTPPPGEWCEMVEGSEPMQWNLTERSSQIISGFGTGTERSIDPPKTDVKMLYNGAPVITEPYAVYYADVIF